MPLLAALVPVLMWVLRIAAVAMVGRVLLAFGLSFAAYKFAVGPIIDHVKMSATGLPADLAVWLGLLRFDQALTVVCSAYVIRFGLSVMHLVKG